MLQARTREYEERAQMLDQNLRREMDAMERDRRELQQAHQVAPVPVPPSSCASCLASALSPPAAAASSLAPLRAVPCLPPIARFIAWLACNSGGSVGSG